MIFSLDPVAGYTGLLENKRAAVIYTGAVYGPARGRFGGRQEAAGDLGGPASTTSAASRSAPRGRNGQRHLASPEPAEADLFRALAAAYQSIEDDGTGTLTAAAEAAGRWEALIAAEVGDAMTARVIRLLGDGITFNTLVGVPVPVDDPAELLDRVTHLAQPRT